MDPPRDQTTLRSSPFQARALHFLKKLALRARGGGGKSRDAVSPVAIPTHSFHRGHSVDILRKPDISRLIGFRAEDAPSPTMDTDDSSQDASASSNSHRIRPRRHSALDALHSMPAHSTFAGYGTASAFRRDQGSTGDKFLVDEPVNLLAPAPVFQRSNPSLEAVVQPLRSAVPSPKISLEIGVPPEWNLHEEAVPYTLDDDTARPLGDDLSQNATLTTPMTDLTTSTSSYPGTFSDVLPVLQNATSEGAAERPPMLARHSAPLPPPFRVSTERGLRLSPSIITRHPMPLLNLPTLPPPTSPAPDTPSRPRVPLRSIPLLSLHGHSNDECQADHENATLGDSDEDEGDEGDEEGEFIDALSAHQSDDEDDEPPSAGSSSNPGSRVLQKQRMRDHGSLSESPVSLTPPQNGPVGPSPADACSKTYVKAIHIVPSSNSLAMYPFSPNIPSSEDAVQPRARGSDSPAPGSRLEKKPSLYHAASRSMVNLGSTRRAEPGSRSLRPMQSNVGSVSGHTDESTAESEESDTEAVIGRLLRRTSMPSFHPTSDPPPYPTFDPRPKESRFSAHEDEGREWLPAYSNSLYLIAIMPRKMEFSSPGVQAKDRKWRRVVCELEGTTFRVYKCPPGASGAGVLGDWWEKRVGVGDVTSSAPRMRKKEEQFETPTKLGIDEPSTSTMVMMAESSERSLSVSPAELNRRRRESQSSMATQSTVMTTPRRVKRTSGASFLSPFRSSSTTRPEGSLGEPSRRRESRELELLPVDTQSTRSSLSRESSGRATPVTQRSSPPPPPRSATRLSFLPVATGRVPWRNGEISKPPASDLIHAYTLQHAESGLGNDYLKRKNVIRVRLEGEQFLLQAPDVPAVVEWIEGLHAGSNIALDIDQRPMPRGPMFPRRRRRRARRPQGDTTVSQRTG